MVRILFIGDVEPQASAVWNFLATEQRVSRWLDVEHLPDLIVVAGYRRLIPASVLAIPRLGTIGFHSAKLPEYPGRAPVPWAILRGDTETENTMLYLDAGIDSGDIIDRRIIPMQGIYDSPERIYREMARTCVELLDEHLPAILEGTAPRTPQDTSKRGPLTSANGWSLLAVQEHMATGHA